MSHENLAIYLNDHLAGSVGAIGLLDHLIGGTVSPQQQVELEELQQEIVADQDLLKDLLESISSEESPMKKAGAWMAEKLARAKLKLTKAPDSGLGELETFEVLSLGIEGKAGLWKVLAEVFPNPAETRWDWTQLIDSAQAQRQKVEAWRMEAARKAFLTPLPPSA